jgi:hypothetical protein
MRTSLCRIANRRVTDEPRGTIALVPGAQVASLLRRSAGGLGLGPRRPPVPRRLRPFPTELLPLESRIVFRARAVARR